MKRPVVAFHDIEAEIYKKAEEWASADATEGSDEDEDDDQDEEREPAKADDDQEFELDDDIDLASSFLRNMLADTKPSVLSPRGLAAPAVASLMEVRNREATEEEWANV